MLLQVPAGQQVLVQVQVLALVPGTVPQFRAWEIAMTEQYHVMESFEQEGGTRSPSLVSVSRDEIDNLLSILAI